MIPVHSISRLFYLHMCISSAWNLSGFFTSNFNILTSYWQKYFQTPNLKPLSMPKLRLIHIILANTLFTNLTNMASCWNLYWENILISGICDGIRMVTWPFSEILTGKQYCHLNFQAPQNLWSWNSDVINFMVWRRVGGRPSSLGPPSN